jgi:hypothetical protein
VVACRLHQLRPASWPGQLLEGGPLALGPHLGSAGVAGPGGGAGPDRGRAEVLRVADLVVSLGNGGFGEGGVPFSALRAPRSAAAVSSAESRSANAVSTS